MHKIDRIVAYDQKSVPVNSNLSNGHTNPTMTRRLPKTDSQYDLWHLKKEKEKEELAKISLFRSPIKTTYYFLRETLVKLKDLILYILQHKIALSLALIAFVLITVGRYIEGQHSSFIEKSEQKILWYSWWVLLGFLSSCGFGTGLHTFLIYLGPFIAKVTLAAYECHSTKFPEPPYPNDINCPPENTPKEEITMLSIILKVQVEAVLWGVGTAIGELPPYFMARAARLSGIDPDDEEFDEFEELLNQKEKGKNLSIVKRMEMAVKDAILKVGFVGIVLCASIPNPFFDLAGMTCGHFNVPFWSFFGATLIGKAFIKMHIQQLFVIAVFSEHHFQKIVELIGYIPKYGANLRQPVEEYLEREKMKLHHGKADPNQSWMQFFIGVFVWMMILYFLYSIINMMAKSYYRRNLTSKTEQKYK